MIGFSVLTNQYKYALEIAAALRTYYDRPIVFGGIHPTMDPHGTLKEPVLDSICVGEGEEAFLESIRAGNPGGVRNMGYRDGGRTVLEPLRPYTDLVRLPPKDYEIFDFQRMIDAKDGWVGLLASRGCPFRCTYCLNHRIIKLYKDSGHLPKDYIRRHTVDQVVGEIDSLLSRYKRIGMFIFDDDLFTFDKSLAPGVRGEIPERDPDRLCLQRPREDVRRGGGRLPEAGRVQDSEVRRRERKREDAPGRALPVHDQQRYRGGFQRRPINLDFTRRPLL